MMRRAGTYALRLAVPIIGWASPCGGVRRAHAEPAAEEEGEESVSRLGRSGNHARLIGLVDQAQPGPTGGDVLSVDLGLKKLRAEFHDERARRCLLCNEYLGSLGWALHCNFYPHQAREAVMLEMLAPWSGTPTEIFRSWDDALAQERVKFQRIPGLAGDLLPIGSAVGDQHERLLLRAPENAPGHPLAERRRRVRYLLRFLQDHGVLRECFRVSRDGVATARSFHFDRLEWVGDNVNKCVISDRVACMYPHVSPAARGRLGYFNSMVDSNEGLVRIFDFFGLQDLCGQTKVVAKFKSDVVEALSGELHAFLWSNETHTDTAQTFRFPLDTALAPLCAVVQHTLDEMAHAMLLLHVDGVRAALEHVLKAKGIRLVRADRRLRGLDDRQRAVKLLRRLEVSLALAQEPTPPPSTDLPSEERGGPAKPVSAFEAATGQRAPRSAAVSPNARHFLTDRHAGLSREGPRRCPTRRWGSLEPPHMERGAKGFCPWLSNDFTTPAAPADPSACRHGLPFRVSWSAAKETGGGPSHQCPATAEVLPRLLEEGEVPGAEDDAVRAAAAALPAWHRPPSVVERRAARVVRAGRRQSHRYALGLHAAWPASPMVLRHFLRSPASPVPRGGDAPALLPQPRLPLPGAPTLAALRPRGVLSAQRMAEAESDAAAAIDAAESSDHEGWRRALGDGAVPAALVDRAAEHGSSPTSTGPALLWRVLRGGVSPGAVRSLAGPMLQHEPSPCPTASGEDEEEAFLAQLPFVVRPHLMAMAAPPHRALAQSASPKPAAAPAVCGMVPLSPWPL